MVGSISSAKIKRFLKEEHTVEEYIEFLYKAVYELYDKCEEMEAESKGRDNLKKRIQIKLL